MKLWGKGTYGIGKMKQWVSSSSEDTATNKAMLGPHPNYSLSLSLKAVYILI